MKTEKLKIDKIKLNPNNPRFIKDDKFKKLVQSVTEFPDMLEIRPVVVNKDNIIIGGNMRYRAALELGYTEIPVQKVTSLTEEQEKEFTIKDNLAYGDWDWNELANNWDSEKLSEWSLDIPEMIDVNKLDTNFNLPEGDKSPFQQMTFTLADEQAEQIKNAIEDIKKTQEYKYVETMGNENSNGNALYLIIMQWVGQKK